MNSIVILIFFSSIQLLAQREIILTDFQNEYSLNPYTDILFDQSKKLKIEDVIYGKGINKFRALKEEEYNLGYRKGAVWLRFKVKNETEENKKWLLNFNYGGIDEVNFYTPSEGKEFIKKTAGIKYPMQIREIQHRLIVFPFTLNKQKEKTFYAQIESRYSTPLNVKIILPSKFFQSEQNTYLVLGIFYGSLLIIALYNLFLFLSVKDISYLYYSLYVVIIGYYQTHIDGIGYQLIDTNMPMEYNLLVAIISSSAIVIFGGLFTREFLTLRNYSKLLDWIFLTLILMLITYLILAVSFQLLYSQFTGPLAIFYILLSLVTCIYCSWKGNRNAKFFLIATIAFIIGTSLRAFRLFGILETSVITEYGMQAGTLIEMTILSFALGNRINDIKRNEEKEKSLIRSRISSDLHDEIGSNLSSISLSSQMIQRSSLIAEKEKKQLEEITLTAKETADSIRDIIWFINPENDKTNDLISKMEDTAAKMLLGKEYSFNVNVRKISEKNLQFRRNLFLIYKEILNNIAKHSEAKCIEITMEDKSGEFLLKVVDDGKGYNMNNVRYGEGIKNIKKRIMEIGGNMKINSEQSKGTSILITIKNRTHIRVIYV